MENTEIMNEGVEENTNGMSVQEETVEVDTEKAARFQEESKDRMSKICQQIAFLEKIATKRTVDYTQANVDKMFAYLESKLADCKATFMAKFENEKPQNDFDFDF